MALIRVLTFESGNLVDSDAYTGSTGSTHSIISDNPIVGAYSHRLHVTASLASGTNGSVSTLPSPSYRAAIAFYVRLEAAPDADGTQLFQAVGAFNAARWGVVVNTDRTLQLQRINATGTKSPPLTLGEVYRVEVHNNLGDANVLALRLAQGDGASTLVSSTTANTSAVEAFRFGTRSSAERITVVYDEIRIDDAEIPVLPALPGDGTITVAPRSGVTAGSRIAINVDRATAIRSGIVAGSRISITAQAKVPLTLRTGIIAGSRIAIRAQAAHPVTLRSGVVAGSRITVMAAAPTDALVTARSGIVAGSRIAVRADVPVRIRAGVIVGTRAQVAVDGPPIDIPGALANLKDLAYYGRGVPPDDAINLAAVTILETASVAAALGSAHHLAAITALEIGAVATLGGAHNLSAVTALETAAAERYAGPGTGLVVGDPAAFDLTRQINELREGDRTHVLLGWAGAEGRSGLIRVMRRMPDEGRDRQDIEPAFQPIPDPALISKQRGGRQPAVDTGRQVRYFQQLKRQQRQDD